MRFFSKKNEDPINWQWAVENRMDSARLEQIAQNGMSRPRKFVHPKNAIHSKGCKSLGNNRSLQALDQCIKTRLTHMFVNAFRLHRMLLQA